jgi:NADPH:quinone reductase-like Zn-dependent oxidoreductase
MAYNCKGWGVRAAVFDRYGGPEVVRVDEVATPAPGRGQVLVRVRAAAVTSADSRIRAARFPAGFAVPARLVFGVRRPRRPVLGSAFAGVVEALGPGVDGPAVGDRVCGMTGMRMGAHAEQVVVRADRAVPVPDGVGDDDAAAALFGGTTALYFLRDRACLDKGSSVLVNGASGAIGTMAVQLAKRAGAVVTGVTSGPNADLVIGLGADDVLDYRREDLGSTTARFDVVLDTVGNLTIASGRRLLAPDGRLLLAVATLGQTLRARGDVAAGTSGERPEDMAHLLELVRDGELRVVLDRVGSLDDVVDLHRRVDSGRKVGNVVLRP